MKTVPHQPLFAQHPLAQLAVAFSAGILVSNLLPNGLKSLLTLFAVLSTTSLVAFLRDKRSSAVLSLLLAMFFAGAYLALLEKQMAPTNGVKQLIAEGVVGTNDPVELTGTLDGPAEFAREEIYLKLKVESLNNKRVERKASGAILLLASAPTRAMLDEYLDLELHYGARIRVMTTLDRSDKYRNPGVSTLTEYLDRKGYDATGFVKSPLLIERLEDRGVFLPLAWLYDRRQRLQRQIDERFSPETAGVLDAALLGNRYNLSRSTAERFRTGGTFHVLVISGLHISFIGGVVLLLSRRLTKKRSLQFLFSTVVLWSYTFAVGAEGSVVRAAVMFTFVTLGTLVFRQASSLNALGGTALVLLIWNPQELFNPSLQLTFISVLAIVVIAWPLLLRMSAVGAWHPTRQTPYPPTCAGWLRHLCEILFWSERTWRAEMARSAHTYRLFKTPLAARLERYHLQYCARYAFGAVVVSLSVQVALLPLQIIYFHRLSMASVVLNVSVSLLLAALSTVALVGLLLSQISLGLAAPFFKLANGLDWLMVHSVDPFAKFGLASLRLPEYSGRFAFLYALYYLPLVVLVIRLSRWHPLGPPVLTRNKAVTPARQTGRGAILSHKSFPALIGQAGMLALVVFHPFSSDRPDGSLHVDFLDVGQGDSALVTMPDGTTLLIDGGGRPGFLQPTLGPTGHTETEPEESKTRSIGETVVSEYLWWRGLDRVDYILATHADADHIDGLNDVDQNFAVRSALVARMPVADLEYSRFAQTLTLTHTPVDLIQAGDVMRFGPVEIRVLWPPAAASANAPSGNNDSIVLRLKFGERAILLTGDIENEAENAMLRAQQNLGVDVVKVAHHGSKTSSNEQFVRATQPSLAIISVGQTSMFGHPHKEVVERWQSSGAEVLTTGRSGTISVTTDGHAMKVERFVPD